MSADANVFIFNFNENNEENVKLLKNTFEKFNCIVKVYEKLKQAEIKAAALEISAVDFELFEYIAVVVLDERNKSEDVIRSSDDHVVMLHSEFLTIMLENKSLKNKNVLFLLQINRTYPDEDDDLMYEAKTEAAAAEPRRPQIMQRCKKFFLYATETMHPLPENGNDIFIKEFCKVFSEHGDKYKITKILDELRKDLKSAGYSARPTMEKSQDHCFGKALPDDFLRDYYAEEYLERGIVED